MTDNSYYMKNLQLQGFRAFLQPKRFDFSQKRCLALFAPNGKGKSSLIDGLEFMFSSNGILERLGQRTRDNSAGVVALPHNLAEENGVQPRVSITFKKGQTVTDGFRDAGPGRREQPECSIAVNGCFNADPIIRGFELRTFVENHTPEKRYAEVAKWLQLTPLVELQRNLRALRQQVKASAEDMSALEQIDVQLAKETADAVTEWHIDNVLEYINDEVIAPLDDTLNLGNLDQSDITYVAIVVAAEAEEHQLGLVGLKQIRNAAVAVYNQKENEDTGEMMVSGSLPSFEAAVESLTQTETKEAEEQAKAATAVFQDIWEAAEPLFAEGVPDLDACPVCMTDLTESKAGSIAGVRAHVAGHLAGLAEYATAKQALDAANVAATTAHRNLIAVLLALPALLGDGYEKLLEALDSYSAVVDPWPLVDIPESQLLVAELSSLVVNLDRRISEIEDNQGEHTYSKAKAKIDRLLELQENRDLALKTQTELAALSDSLIEQANAISTDIRKKVQTLLDILQAPMNSIYRQIQGDHAAPIHLELPSGEETNQQRLYLVIDFAENRTGVQPGGYLSDSQIHSVALALRLAAIKQFNKAAPIIALDDIVTSYDAEHRRTIVSMIATEFSDCQLIITTHDERFFSYLKDQLAAKDWQFSRITRLDHDYGPRFADDKVTDVMIEDRWNQGLSAANEMRQAEEEWLLKMCREFGTNIRIRSLEKAYSYERSELAAALAGFLRDAGLSAKPVPGVNNRFLNSLQQGVVENFGSHFQEGPFGDGSIGDEKARWEEFKMFRSQFVCSKCNRSRFKRPFGLSKPVCLRCEAQFDFKALVVEEA